MFEEGYYDFCDQGYNIYILANGVKYIKENKETYVLLANRTPYKLMLENKQNTNCFAVVYVDGIRMGSWGIGAHSSVTIYRPTWVYKRFYFGETPTSYTKNWRLQDYPKTVIKVDFYPESLNASQNRMSKTCKDRSFNRYYKGGVMLSGYSDETSKLVTLDYDKSKDNKTTLTINVVVDTRYHKPFITSKEHD